MSRYTSRIKSKKPCKNGHPFNSKTVHIRKVGKYTIVQCRACEALWQRARYKANKEKLACTNSPQTDSTSPSSSPSDNTPAL